MGSTTGLSASVRRGGPADEAFTARLGGDAFRDFDPRAREHTLSLVRGRGATTLVAYAGEERLGFAVVEVSHEGVALLQAIAVEPHARGRGVGTALLRAAEKVAEQRSCRRLRLCTADANVEALDLFLKRGFRIAVRFERFYTNGQDACALEKRLSPANESPASER